MGISNIFKPEIVNSGGYKGGQALGSSHKKMYKLSSNENILGSAGQSEPPFYNLYPSGTPEPLYQALSRFYNHQLTPDHFIAGNGGSELLQLICQAFLDNGLNAIISSPCFAPYRMFCEWTGATVKDIGLLTPNYRLDIDGILAAIDEHTRLIFLTAPNNPTGTIINKTELTSLINKIPNHIVVIYDEVYRQFVNDPSYTTAEAHVRSGQPIIGINSFSKSFGLAGLRIGYGYSTPEISAYIRKIIRPFLINQFSMQQAVAALSDQEFLDKTVTTVMTQRSLLLEGLAKMKIQHWTSQANFVMIQSDMKEEELAERLLQQGIMARPLSNFGAPDCVRITIGDAESTQATLRALAAIFT